MFAGISKRGHHPDNFFCFYQNECCKSHNYPKNLKLPYQLFCVNFARDQKAKDQVDLVD